MKILKFGGKSLDNGSGILTVLDIIIDNYRAGEAYLPHRLRLSCFGLAAYADAYPEADPRALLTPAGGCTHPCDVVLPHASVAQCALRWSA